MRIFSGIQPTGRKHLGNYIGAITQYVAGQDRGEGIYCVVDLHALTVPYEPEGLRSSVYDTTATLLAAGLDPDRCIFFRQSDVVEHPELTWLLMSVTSYGDLTRMTQFKDKAGKQRERSTAGLFNYPVLMAADVLAYRANEVPVGDDQRQHVELMRDIAAQFNARFGETLVVPEARIPEVGARIMDLKFPDRKMSTTSRHPRRAGVRHRRARRDRQEVSLGGDRHRFRGPPRARQARDHEPDRDPRGRPRGGAGGGRARVRGSQYGPFKQAVADAVIDYLAPVRERYQELRDDERGPRAHARERGRQGQGDRDADARRRPRGDGRGSRPRARLAFST